MANANIEETLGFAPLSVWLALAATTELTYTVAGQAGETYQALFSFPYDAKVWVALGQTIALPTAGTVTSTLNANQQLNPYKMWVTAGQVLHFKSTAIVTDLGITFRPVTNELEQ